MQTTIFRLIEPGSPGDLEKYYRLRFEILRKPWNQPEKTTKDDAEDRSVHVMLLDENNEAIACGRLQINSPEEGQIRSMAVRTDMQGKKLGSRILRYLEEKAREMRMKRLTLDSRKPAEGFYIKHGFETIGESYLLFGQIPHVKMSKLIAN